MSGEKLQAPNHLHLDQSPEDGPVAIRVGAGSWDEFQRRGHVVLCSVYLASVWIADLIINGLLGTVGTASPFQVPLTFSGPTGPVDARL